MIKVIPLTDNKIIQIVIDSVEKAIPGAKLYLFGSRAKGSNVDRSDFDFAVVSAKDISMIVACLNEKFEALDTLKKIELIDYNELDDNFKQIVLKEGKLLNG